MSAGDPTGMDRRSFVVRSAGLTAAVGLLGAAACAAEPSSSSSSSSIPRSTPDGSAPGTSVAPTDPDAIATQAFLAGLPLVITRRTMQTFAGLAGTNRLIRTPGLSNPTSRLVVAPNHDTTYVLAVLDLSAGPLVLTLPAIEDRYHVMQLLDAWMGGFGLIGTRTNGGRGGSYVIAPAGWSGTVPAGTEVLECPTPHAMLLGRIRAVDDADAAVAATIGREISLEPFALEGAPAAALVPLGPAPGTPQSAGDGGAAYFDELGDALASDPPVTAGQRAAIDAAADLGVGPGRHPSTDVAVAGVLTAGVADGQAVLDQRQAGGSTRVNGWDVNLTLGTADTDVGVESRAVIARFFWGPVPAEEAVYPRAAVADDDLPLDGTKRYLLRFGPGQQPPVDAFWSITAYGPDMFLVVNPQNRYSLSGDTPGLVVGEDGSTDLHIQHEVPAAGEANWLPVPAGPFTLIMRLYLPGPAILDGSYDYPPLTVV